MQEIQDSRIRTFIYPVRLVWQTPDTATCRAEKLETLFATKHGQVCEGFFATSTGCRLVNNGGVPGFILDFGKELHGGLHIGMSPSTPHGMRLRLRFGESVSETCSEIGGENCTATNDHAMRDFVLEVPSFGSIEIGNTGYRFVRIDLVSKGEAGFEFIRAISLMRPMTRLGSFKCSDERLNQIWETAVRTVHLCCQEYLWDGIKRDRLVWMGDTHPETMTILNVFGAAPIIPESLDYAASVTPADQWMNTMPPYTLWWIRNLAEWIRFTGDRDYLARHADYLRATLAHVSDSLSTANTWDASGFLDWPTQHNPAAVKSGMQALAAIAFDEAAYLTDELGDSTSAGDCRAKAARIRSVCHEPCGAKSAAAMLALSGLRDPKEMFAQVLGANRHEGVSTFYGYYMLEAMSAAGENQRALDTIRDYWGGMLDAGATSFWEDFNLAWLEGSFRIDEPPVPGKKDIHGDFGEFCYPGFRHSLCHGWSSGPASWCIHHILGISPIGTGTTRAAIRPFLGDLEWAEGAMALPNGGSLCVRVQRKADGSIETAVAAPDGFTIEG